MKIEWGYGKEETIFIGASIVAMLLFVLMSVFTFIGLFLLANAVCLILLVVGFVLTVVMFQAERRRSGE